VSEILERAPSPALKTEIALSTRTPFGLLKVVFGLFVETQPQGE
jgi:hypothetical protein